MHQLGIPEVRAPAVEVRVINQCCRCQCRVDRVLHQRECVLTLWCLGSYSFPLVAKGHVGKVGAFLAVFAEGRHQDFSADSQGG